MINTPKIFKPVIKWSGSKRSQASAIVSVIPASFGTYFEPFVGGGSISYAISPDNGVCGDVCEPLIELWKLIQSQPLLLAESYNENWTKMQREGYQVFYEVREHFNSTGSASDLLFLSRTCVNGLIRFNSKGEFNNSLHHTRPGIQPEALRKILTDWSSRISGIKYVCEDYRNSTAEAKENDFIYLDPPYFNTKGRYYGGIDFDDFYKYLENLNSRGIKYALSFDGSRGATDYSVNLPNDLYKQHILISSGNSSFKKVMDKTNEMVNESLYLNY